MPSWNATSRLSKDSDKATALVLDMPAIVHLITPTRASFFNEYPPLQLIPFIEHQISDYTARVDGLYDIYSPGELKNLLRTVRTGSKQRRTESQGTFQSPKALSGRICSKIMQPKSDIFSYLADELIKHCKDKPYTFVTNKNRVVLSSKPIDFSRISPCTHAEADAMIPLMSWTW